MAEKQEWAVSLVHGVGVRNPDDMIADVTKALSDSNPTLRFGDRKGAPGPIDIRLAKGESDKSVVRVAAAHWGDLSLVEAGFGGYPRTFKNLVGGLRDVALAAAAQPGWHVTLMRAMLQVVFFLVLGPLLALYATATVLSAMVSAPAWDLANSCNNARIAIHFVSASSILLGAAMLYQRGRNKKRERLNWRPFWWSLIAVGGLGIAFFSVDSTGFLHWVFEANDNYEPAAVKGGFTTKSMALYLAANWILQDHVMLLGLLAIGIALFALVSSLVPGLRHTVSRDQRHGLRAAMTSAALLWIVFFVLAQPFDFWAAWAIGQSTGIHDYPRYWYELAILALVLGLIPVFGTVWFVRKLRLRSSTRQGVPLEQIRPMRLLISSAVDWWIAAFVAGIVIYAAIHKLAIHDESAAAADPDYVPFWPIWIGLTVAAVVAGFSTSIRRGLHVACDVVGHFARPKADYPARKAIARRFIAGIRMLAPEADQGPPHLLIIAHSQGTVVVLDQLDKGLWSRELRGKFESVTLVTFGSPYEHLYRHYFPAAFPIPSDGAPTRRFRWCNVYRIDDFVGTKIEGHAVDRQVALPAGGHTDYWRQDVFDQIREFLPP